MSASSKSYNHLFAERIVFRDEDICITTSLSLNGRLFITPPEHLDALVRQLFVQLVQVSVRIQIFMLNVWWSVCCKVNETVSYNFFIASSIQSYIKNTINFDDNKPFNCNFKDDIRN